MHLAFKRIAHNQGKMILSHASDKMILSHASDKKPLVIPNKMMKSTFLHTTMVPEHQIYHCLRKREQNRKA